MKEECPKYTAWHVEKGKSHVKKGKSLILVCSEVNLAFVPKDTWWVDSDAITHISVTMQGCLESTAEWWWKIHICGWGKKGYSGNYRNF